MKRLYNKNEEGIASVVGTLFALLLFVSLLSMFMTQYVPVYMKTNEAQHDLEVLSQFSQIRTVTDLLTITNDVNYTAYAPVTLGAPGIPIFAQQTVGQLSVYPFLQNHSNEYMIINFTSSVYGNVNDIAGGAIQFIAPNKYYVPEAFSFEMGALIRTNLVQNSSSMIVGPSLSISNSSAGINIYVVSLKLTGPYNSITGTDTRGLAFTLYGTSKTPYSVNGNVTFTIHSDYLRSWISFFNTTAHNSGVNPSIGSNTIMFTHVQTITILNVYMNVVITQ